MIIHIDMIITIIPTIVNIIRTITIINMITIIIILPIWRYYHFPVVPLDSFPLKKLVKERSELEISGQIRFLHRRQDNPEKDQTHD